MNLYQKIKEFFINLFEKKDKQLYIAEDNKSVMILKTTLLKM